MDDEPFYCFIHEALDKRRQESIEFYANAERRWNSRNRRMVRWLQRWTGRHAQTKAEYDQRIDALARELHFIPRHKIKKGDTNGN